MLDDIKLLYVIILNYNGWTDTVDCVNSVRNIEDVNYKILVIDNGSKEVPKLELLEQNVEYIHLDKNLGYAGGNNVGIKYALEQGASYICLLNNDTKVEKKLFAKLISELEKPDIGIVGPATLFWNSDKVHSTGAVINFYKGTSKLINFNEQIQNVKGISIECDYLEGSCLLFKSSLIEKVGYIPEEYFLYFEETEWCCKIRNTGLKVVCVPKARLWHKISASTGKVSGLKVYFEDRNRVLFVKRNASLLERIVFTCYYGTQFLYRIIRKERGIKDTLAVRDGIFGHINENIFK